MRTSAAAPPANGKVSIAQLVDDGFLLPGNVIVCNNWPFTAVVTPTGTFEARWQPFPNDLVADVGTEYMQAEFVTPSAWATAVCRVMRAQTRAQKAGHAPAQDPPLSPSFVGTGGGRGGSRGKPASASAAGEIRVAVNGWTACRVLVQKGDPNRQLAHQLCSEADQAAGADDAAIEVTLDALRREFVAHNSRRGRAAGRRAAETPKATPQQRREARKSLAALSAGSEDGSGQQMMAVDDAHEGGTGTGTGDTGAGGGGGSGGAGSDSEPEQPLAVDARRTSAEIREITGAVDGLAKRVESDLALGCVKQRRAAAAAADAISAAASALTLSSFFQVAQQTGDAAGSQAQGGARKLVHSRKRKSIPDLSRHTKLSRVPTEDSDGSVSPNRASMLRLDPQTRDQLTRFRGSAAALKRAQPELKALRYQRKQQLKRRIADALDLWVRRRRRHHREQLCDCTRARTVQCSGWSSAARTPRPRSPQQSGAASPTTLGAGGAFPQCIQTHLRRGSWGANAIPQPPSTLYAATRISSVRLPYTGTDHGASGLPQLCTLCGSTGDTLLSCRGCGDLYHDFCVAAALPHAALRREQLVCPACRVCVRCLGNPLDGSDAGEDSGDLLQCAECGIHMHAGCSHQRSSHQDGLAAAASDNGRWICDNCVSCSECGFVMSEEDAAKFGNDQNSPTSSDSKAATEWRLQVSWAYDFSMCGQCAQHIERGRVCPECVSTYANSSKVSNSNMVCCDICAFWVHTDCDPCLSPSVYDALITLEDAPYVCPQCMAAGSSSLDPGLSESIQSPSDDGYDSDDGVAPAGLPRCLLSLSVDPADTPLSRLGDLRMLSLESSVSTSPPLPKESALAASAAIKGEPETEAANLLLSLTRSDVRFGRDRFDVETLEARHCVRRLSMRFGLDFRDDWRQCALCGLHGDGARGPKNTQSQLGRLIPLRTRLDTGAANPVASHWVHVECLAWAWGPRPVAVGSSEGPGTSPQTGSGIGGSSRERLVQFEGSLQFQDSGDERSTTMHCTLCGRPGASFHCCAPVPCYDTAYHLPCLLLSGSPTAHLLPGQEQYSLAWRRALCAAHAPMFSSMMPADAGPPSYNCVRVEGCVNDPPPSTSSLGTADGGDSSSITLVGTGLLVFDWGTFVDVDPTQWTQPLPPGFRCVRVFKMAGDLYSIGICVDSAAWSGWIEHGVPLVADRRKYSDTAQSIWELFERLFARIAPAVAESDTPLAGVLARLAVARPLRFLGLSRCDLRAHLAANAPGYAESLVGS